MDTQNPMGAANSQPKKKKTWLWWLIGVVAAIVIVIVLLVFWIFGGSSGSTKKAANEFLDLLAQDKVTEAYDATSDLFKSATSKEQFEEFIKAFPIITQVKDASFSSIERETGSAGDLTTLTGTITIEDNTNHPIEVVLVLENGVWKIVSVDLNVIDENSDNANKTIDADTAKEISVGEEFELATVKMKVNSSREDKSVSSTYGSPEVAAVGSKFLIVNLTVVNTTKTTSTYAPLQLIDNQGRQYDVSIDANFVLDDYLLQRSLAPDVPETGTVVYEVPEQSKDYYLFVTHAGTGDLIKFKTK